MRSFTIPVGARAGLYVALLLACVLLPVRVAAQPVMPMGVPDCPAGSPTVPAGTTRIISGTESLGCLAVYGTLSVDAGASLGVQTILGYPGSTFRWTGGEIVTADIAPTDPQQWHTGIILAGTIDIRGPHKVRGALLAQAVTAGSSQLTLATDAAALNWRVGDELVVPDSRQYPVALTPETCTIAAVSGVTVTCAAPFTVEHPAALNADGTVAAYPFVANLSSSLVLRSANPAGTRGHFALVGAPTVHIEGLLVRDFGRSTFGSDTDQIGRYCLHDHMTTNTGHVFTGNVVRECSLGGIVLHLTNGHTVSNNAFYRVGGAAIVTETTTERDHLIERNYIVRTVGRGDRGDTFAPRYWRNGTGIWYGATNRVRDNFAANSEVNDYALWRTEGDPTCVLEDARNTSWTTFQASAPWYVGCDERRSVIEDFRAYHSQAGVANYPTRNVTFRNLVVRGNCATFNPNFYTTGIHWGDYDQIAPRVDGGSLECLRNAIIPPYGNAVEMRPRTETRQFVAEDVTFAGNLVDVWTFTPAGAFNTDQQAPFTATIRRGVHRGTRPGGQAYLKEFQLRGNANLIAPIRLLVEPLSGAPFEVFAPEQAPDFVIPATGYAQGQNGKTNAQAWADAGVAIFGAIAGTTAPPPPPPPPPPPVTVTVPCTVQSVLTPYADKDARLTVRCNTNGAVLIPKGTAFPVTVAQ